MRLRWPATGTVTKNITIPNAQLQDTQTVQSNALVRENRGLQPITYKSSQWPTNYITKYTVQTMNDTEKTNLINFLIDTAGDEILVTDHMNVTRTCIMQTPIPELVTMKDGCSYDIEFELIGSSA